MKVQQPTGMMGALPLDTNFTEKVHLKKFDASISIKNSNYNAVIHNITFKGSYFDLN